MEENIIGTVSGIKTAGIATMSYWTIIRTDQAVYFLRTGSAIGLGIGTSTGLMVASVINDIAATSDSHAAAKSSLQDALAKAEESYRFANADLPKLTLKKGLFGGSVIFANGRERSWRESGVIKLKLSFGKWKKFRGLIPQA